MTSNGNPNTGSPDIGNSDIASSKSSMTSKQYGQYWTRTSDILLVRQALYQLS